MTKPDRSSEKYELVLLSDRIDWHKLEGMLDEYYSDVGRKAISTRLMLGLMILKYMKNLSDEEVCAT